MPFADNHGVKIHYEVRGSGPAIVFYHGFGSDLSSWSAYADRLESDYRCVLLDARASGRSDKPREVAAYAVERKAADALVVMDALGIEKAVFWGYSMGGGVGWGAVRYARERFDAIIIGGSEPFRRNRDELRAAAERLRATASPERDVEALYASQMASALDPTSEDLLPGMTMPCLLYVGEDDPRFADAKEAAAAMPNVTFASFPGRDHGAMHRDFEAVLRVAKEFLAKVRLGQPA